jgi:cysteinyl-tRNA synthetase
MQLVDDFDAHLDIVRSDEQGLAQEVERLIAEREAARKNRDFGRADQIREELREKGIALEDSKDGVRWRRVVPEKAL